MNIVKMELDIESKGKKTKSRMIIYKLKTIEKEVG